MLKIFNPKVLEGKRFTRPGAPGNNETYICIGVGQAPEGTNYVVGALWDSVRNVSIIRTELFKNVEFEGDSLMLAAMS
jgi:hypothetical protein